MINIVFWLAVAGIVTLLVFSFLVMVRADSKIAILPDLTKCEDTHFNGSIEYKCITRSTTRGR